MDWETGSGICDAGTATRLERENYTGTIMHIPFEVDPPQKDIKSASKTQEMKSSTFNNSESQRSQNPLTVTQLTRQVALLLEGKFRSLTVEAELSNVKRASSGHWYFSLKDDQSQIRGVMFRQVAINLRFEPEDGLEVNVRGHLTVYQQRGEYQIMVSSMEPKAWEHYKWLLSN